MDNISDWQIKFRAQPKVYFTYELGNLLGTYMTHRKRQNLKYVMLP